MESSCESEAINTAAGNCENDYGTDRLLVP